MKCESVYQATFFNIMYVLYGGWWDLKKINKYEQMIVICFIPLNGYILKSSKQLGFCISDGGNSLYKGFSGLIRPGDPGGWG